jgi:hypothetical protein
MSDQPSLEIAFVEQAGYASATGAVSEKAKDAFDALGSLLSDSIEPLRRKLTEAVASADEIELKLELGLKAEGKWVVLTAGGSATVSLKIVWKHKQT